MSHIGTEGNRWEGGIISTQAESVKVVRTESERLKQYLAAMPEDAWTRLNACALWGSP